MCDDHDQTQLYPDGRIYAPARGRYAPRSELTDLLAVSPAVVDLRSERPTADEFVERILRELKIRFYQAKTMKLYRHALTAFLRWVGKAPHEVEREDARAYLEMLVDTDSSASWVSNNLSAIRAAFDKLCYRDVTFGLATPRKGKRLPVVLNSEEIVRLLQAAPSQRDKLLLGLLYATGTRVSEVVRLRWRDLDFERQVVNVWQGKGRADRQVTLPKSFAPLMRQLSVMAHPEDWVFAGRRARRHLSPRAAQRVMEGAMRLAGIGKAATCHTLRHSYATHLLESGTDIRFIQKLLGHVRLETTRLYTKVAVIEAQAIESPLDSLLDPDTVPRQEAPRARVARPVGQMMIEMELTGESRAAVTLRLESSTAPVVLTGIVVEPSGPSWLTIDLPPLEAWKTQLAWLTPEQRERVESPEFFGNLTAALGERFRRLCGESESREAPEGTGSNPEE